MARTAQITCVARLIFFFVKYNLNGLVRSYNDTGNAFLTPLLP